LNLSQRIYQSSNLAFNKEKLESPWEKSIKKNNIGYPILQVWD